MPRIKLSDVGLRAISPPESGTADYWDTALPSFGVRVSRGGAKTFILKLHNSRRAIGRFGIISLADARTEARRILAEKTLGKVRPQSITFPRAVELFLAEKAKGRRPSTVADLSDRLSRHFPFKGQLADITHQDIVRRLSSIKTNREHNHALRVGKTFFTWALNRRFITENPTIGISTRATSSRARVLSDEELGRIWKACEQCCVGRFGAKNGTEDMAARLPNDGVGTSQDLTGCRPLTTLPTNFCTIVRLLILTGQRRGEIAALQSSWITQKTSKNLDETSIHTKNSQDFWTITLPKEVTKNGREHSFPVGALTAELICDTAQDTALLFPARGSTTKPFNGWSKSKAALDKLSGVTDWTLHDLRRTYATRLAELGVAPHIIERLLNHASGQISGVAAVYNRAKYLVEMRTAVELFEAHLQKVISSP